MIVADIADFREAARCRLPRFLFEYIDGGSYAEVTLGRNVTDLRDVALRQRVLRDVSDLNLTTELFGQKLALPVALAPIGLAGLNARRGECQAVMVAEREVIEARDVMDTRRKEYIEANRRLKTVQKLEETARERHRLQVLRTSQEELDELAGFRAFRQPALS